MEFSCVPYPASTIVSTLHEHNLSATICKSDLTSPISNLLCYYNTHFTISKLFVTISEILINPYIAERELSET